MEPSLKNGDHRLVEAQRVSLIQNRERGGGMKRRGNGSIWQSVNRGTFLPCAPHVHARTHSGYVELVMRVRNKCDWPSTTPAMKLFSEDAWMVEDTAVMNCTFSLDSLALSGSRAVRGSCVGPQTARAAQLSRIAQTCFTP